MCLLNQDHRAFAQLALLLWYLLASHEVTGRRISPLQKPVMASKGSTGMRAKPAAPCSRDDWHPDGCLSEQFTSSKLTELLPYSIFSLFSPLICPPTPPPRLYSANSVCFKFHTSTLDSGKAISYICSADYWTYLLLLQLSVVFCEARGIIGLWYLSAFFKIFSPPWGRICFWC